MHPKNYNSFADLHGLARKKTKTKRIYDPKASSGGKGKPDESWRSIRKNTRGGGGRDEEKIEIEAAEGVKRRVQEGCWNNLRDQARGRLETILGA